MKRLAALLVMSLVAACSPESAGPWSSGSDQLQPERTWLRLHTEAPAKLARALREAGLDVTGAPLRRGFVDVLLDGSRGEQLPAAAERYIKRVEPLAPASARALSDYHNPDEVSTYLTTVQNAHPTIAQKVQITTGLPEGHTIWALKISDNVTADEDEPVYLMDGQIHAREVMTTEVMLDAIDYLTSRYGSDSQVTRWVDEMEIWIVPVVNPDGAAVVFTSDSWWRKNRSHNCGADIGVDLNRNFAWNWRACEGSDDYCSSETYHGPSAGSEPETQAMQELHAALRPLYYINYHSYGEYIIWPTACFRTEEQAMLAEIGSAMNDVLENDDGQTGQYAIGTAGDVLYTAPGGADDSAYGDAGAVAFTIEVNSWDFQPDFATWRDITVQRQRAAWMLLLDRTLDGPSVGGHTFDAGSGAPIPADYVFANHPFTSGQAPLQATADGRFGRVVAPNSEHVMVFTAAGYLPETRVVQVADGPVEFDVPMTQGTNHAPTASAGPDQTVIEGDDVTLDASASSDPDGNTLFFIWTQTGGPTVALQDAYTAQPHFFAPSVDADTAFTFRVVASDGALESTADTVVITVQDMWNETSTFPSSGGAISIPDNNPTGISSTIHITEDRRILKAVIHVDITHTYIGDLVVNVTSPAGPTVVLHDREGGSTANLHANYEVAEYVGQMSGGDWVLRVYDLAGSDTGTLDGWSVALDLVGDPACGTAADCDLPNATPACVTGHCEIVSCDAGWGDCNALTVDGCEADLAGSPSHCGNCGLVCSFPHAAALCVDSSCELGACTTGYGNCNGIASDGCESNLSSDPAHCGSCTNACSLPHASAGCQNSACVISSCTIPWANCNTTAADGCEADTSSDTAHCGNCATACSFPHAGASCVSSACTLGACQTGWENCNGLTTDGCEAQPLSDPANCGACGTICNLPHAVEGCSAGSCTIAACESSWGDCNATSADGCETNTDTSTAHCGDCNHPCELAHAAESCVGGSCTLGTCEGSWMNCNGLASDGCEADVDSDPNHCGGCTTVCTFLHASGACQAGNCALGTCDPGWSNCDGNAANGCELPTSADPTNCGGCGVVCNLPHASSGCSNSTCVVTACQAPWLDCNGLPTDGCETDPAGDPDHCGDCQTACSYPHAAGLCQAGSCAMGACEAAYGDCDGQVADGCEAELATDPGHCGDCTTICAFDHAFALCTDGACDLGACEAGWGDCDGLDTNGCESDVRFDPAHCGDCDTACTFDHATALCTDSACVMGSCETGFADCNAQATDGCEADLDADPAHCGDCQTACAYEHATALCHTGACALGACDGDWGDCDGQDANGCETSVRSDPGHCGDCQTACAGGEFCVAGICRDTCPDDDGDGYATVACGGDDCNDLDAAVHPGATELCNGIDDDCDDAIDDDCVQEEEGGCGCAAPGSASDTTGLGLGLLAFAWLRRRRSKRAGRGDAAS